MRKRNILLLTIILLVIIAAAAFIVWQRQVSPQQTQRLPDGRLATLEGVSYGDNITVGSNIFGATTISGSPSSNSNNDFLIFCLSLPNEWGSYGSTHDVTLDEHGCWMSQGSAQSHLMSFGKTSYFGITLGNEKELKLVSLTAFPRRGQTVILQLFDNDGKGPIAEFTAPNPTPGPHPVWTPEPLPIKKQVGDLTFALTELKAGLDSRGGSASPGDISLTRASFRITEQGKPVKSWSPVRFEVSDATGNHVSEEVTSPFNYKYNYRNGEMRVELQRMLCIEETWKLRVEFAQSSGEQFTADQIWTLRGLTVPGQNTLISSNETAMREGYTLRLVGIGGRGRVEWSPEYASSGDQIKVRARVSLPCDGMRLSLLATDDKGRKFTGFVQGYKDVDKDNEREFSFSFQDIPSDARSLDLTFAIHKSLYAEYLVKPSVP